LASALVGSRCASCGRGSSRMRRSGRPCGSSSTSSAPRRCTPSAPSWVDSSSRLVVDWWALVPPFVFFVLPPVTVISSLSQSYENKIRVIDSSCNPIVLANCSFNCAWGAFVPSSFDSSVLWDCCIELMDFETGCTNSGKTRSGTDGLGEETCHAL
jgi:hypothetical protein